MDEELAYHTVMQYDSRLSPGAPAATCFSSGLQGSASTAEFSSLWRWCEQSRRCSLLCGFLGVRNPGPFLQSPLMYKGRWSALYSLKSVMTSFFFFVLKVRLFTEHQVDSLWMSPTMLESSVKSMMKLVVWIGVNHECIVSIEPGSGQTVCL